MFEEIRGEQIERREELLKQVGNDVYKLKCSTEMGVVWAMGYWLLLLLPLGIAAMFLPYSPTVRILFWLLGAALPASAIGFCIYRKAHRESIIFDRNGFRVLRDEQETQRESWQIIESFSMHGREYWITRTDGTQARLSMPVVSQGRERRLLVKIFQTYRIYSQPQGPSRKVIVISCLSFIAGVCILAPIGRPEILSQSYDGPVGQAQYQQMALWCLGVMMLVSGLVGPLFQAFKFIEKQEKRAKEKQVSRFGPTLSNYLDANAYWPEPVELVSGKQYRYIDPDGVAKSLRDRQTGYWILIAFFSMLLGIAAIGAVISFKQSKPDASGLAATSCGFLAAVIWCGFGLRYQRQKPDVSEDVISIADASLIVNRNGQLFSYPRQPQKGMKDSLPKKEKRMPFGKLEVHGTKPDLYEIDRRYLMEIPDQD